MTLAHLNEGKEAVSERNAKDGRPDTTGVQLPHRHGQHQADAKKERGQPKPGHDQIHYLVHKLRGGGDEFTNTPSHPMTELS